MKTHQLILGFLALAALSSCADRFESVGTLSTETRNNINQSLRNGVVPTPEQVAQNNVPAAKDECVKFRKTIPADWFQEKLEVPENPAEPDGRKIKIFYYGKITPGTIPTIFYNGGPTYSSHSSFDVFQTEQPKHDLDKKVSFVYIDQRGTGCSDFYPQMPDQHKPDIDTLKRLSNYGSAGIVADSELVRAKVYGNKKWNVFGQSYGAFIVHRYIIDQPKSVNAGLAHANILQSDGFQRMKFRLASQARLYSEYLKAYPDDKKRLEIFRDYLIADRCYKNVTATDEICGADVLSVLNDLMGFNETASLHKWISAIVKIDAVNDEYVKALLAGFYFNDDANPINTTGWANAVIGWTDRGTVGFSWYNCWRSQKELLAETNVDLNDVLVGECAGALQFVRDNKPEFKEPAPSPTSQLIHSLTRNLMTPQKFAEVLKANSQLPFYLYSGQLDSFVPVANFQEELGFIKDIPNAHYQHFMKSGHDGFYSEIQVWTDLIGNSVPATVLN